MPAPTPALCQEVAWKNGELRRFCCALVRAALEKGGDFTTDIVPDSARGDGPGMAGSAITVLKNATVIEPVGVVNNGKFYADRVKSERPNAKDRWLNVYRLTSVSMAKSFLERNSLVAEARPFVATPQDLFKEPSNLAAIAA